MRFLLALAGVAVAAAVGFVGWVCIYEISSDSSPEKIKSRRSAVVRTTIDVGEVTPGTTVKRTVDIPNDSKKTWTVARVQSDCGCLVHDIQPTRFGPGQVAQFEFDYTAPDSAKGRIGKRMVVLFEESDAPCFVINVDGIVQPWCFTNPDKIDFGVLSFGDTAGKDRNITLFLREDEKLQLATSGTSVDWFHAKEIGNDKSTERIVMVSPLVENMSTRGRHTGKLVIASMDKGKPAVSIPVQAGFEPAIEVTPESLFLGSREREKKFEEQVRVRIPDGSADIQAASIEIKHDLDGLIDAVVVDESENEFVVTCSFRTPRETGYFVGRIKVFVNKKLSAVIPVQLKTIEQNRDLSG